MSFSRPRRAIFRSSGRRERLIQIWASVAVELPLRSHVADEIEVEVGHDELVFVARRFGEDAAPRIAEVRRAVELADAPRRFVPNAVVRADEVAVRDRVRRLLELP